MREDGKLRAALDEAAAYLPCELMLRLEAEFARLTAIAGLDPLTGLANRGGWMDALDEAQERLDRHHEPVGVIVLDLDGLKTMNDTKGHDAGDASIVTAARVIRSTVRHLDVVARVGGDEFAVLMPRAGWDAVHKLAERLQDALDAAGAPASIGCATSAVSDPAYRRVNEVVSAADALMYLDKERRRAARNMMNRDAGSGDQ